MGLVWATVRWHWTGGRASGVAVGKSEVVEPTGGGCWQTCDRRFFSWQSALSCHVLSFVLPLPSPPSTLHPPVFHHSLHPLQPDHGLGRESHWDPLRGDGTPRRSFHAQASSATEIPLREEWQGKSTLYIFEELRLYELNWDQLQWLISVVAM